MYGGIPAHILFDLADLRKEAKKRIVFLDIDGVLNTGMSRSNDVLLNPDNVSVLNSLVSKINASVVISSTWRIQLELDCISFAIRCAGAGAYTDIWDITPKKLESYDRGSSRGYYINEWLNGHDYTKYIIIDDLHHSDFLPDQQKFLITTNDDEGLLEKHIDVAFDMMGSSETQIRIQKEY